jgi:hypothetical protein
MRAMMLIVLCAMVGCAGNNAALQARVNAAETRQAELHAKMDQTEKDADTCVQATIKLREAEAYLQGQADRAWIALQAREAAAEPAVKQSVSDGIDSVEQAITNATNSAVERGKQWSKDHNFSK